MSTLRVTNLQQASSASPNITLDASTNATVAGTLAMGSSFKRNRIINGDMRVDQRNAGASVTSISGTYIVDRWMAFDSVGSKFTAQQNAGSVTPPVGFTNYLGATSTSAYSITATDQFNFQQRIEGFNVSDLAWGTANAKTITVSFWVYSSLTGTFGGSILGASTRSYPFDYTISSSNTWTYITKTIPGDTSGTWVTNNGVGLRIYFSLGTGSTYSAASGSWLTGSYQSTTGATSVVGTNGATFYITGVQLEVGTVATPYERQIYNEQLAQCQRYYLQTATTTNSVPTFYSYVVNGVTIGVTSMFPVAMRIAPTATVSGTWATAGTAATAPSIGGLTTLGYLAYIVGNSGTAISTYFQPNGSGYVSFAAEL